MTTLDADVGDVIRITSDMNGQGTVPAGSTGIGIYHPTLFMNFTVPEPTTAATLLLAANEQPDPHSTDPRTSKAHELHRGTVSQREAVVLSGRPARRTWG